MSEGLGLMLQHQKITLRKLAELRGGVEGFVAAKAVKRAEKVDLRQLTTILKSILKSIRKHRDATEFSWKKVIIEDSKFHLSFARIAGNRVFESILDTVYKNINRYFDRFLSKGLELQEKNHQDLCKIVEAIEKRDSKKAQALVQDHVKYFNRMMKKGEQAAKTEGSNGKEYLNGAAFEDDSGLERIRKTGDGVMGSSS